MVSSEERIRILAMLQEGKITADEADRLLNALGQSTKAPSRTTPMRDRRHLKVRVTDIESGRTKINVNIPMGLINMGMRMGARFIPTDSDLGVDIEDLMTAIENGETGKFIDAEDFEKGERVEVWVE